MPGRYINRKSIASIVQETAEHKWVLQPIMAGTRAILGTQNGRVYLFDENGQPLEDIPGAQAFSKIGDGACLDGVIADGTFHPFECLACQGRSLIHSTVDERAVMAYTVARFAHQRWMFDQPSIKFMEKLRANEPRWKGVILKRDRASYEIREEPDEVSFNWTYRSWISSSSKHGPTRRIVGANGGVKSRSSLSHGNG